MLMAAIRNLYLEMRSFMFRPLEYLNRGSLSVQAPQGCNHPKAARLGSAFGQRGFWAATSDRLFGGSKERWPLFEHFYFLPQNGQQGVSFARIVASLRKCLDELRQMHLCIGSTRKGSLTNSHIRNILSALW